MSHFNLGSADLHYHKHLFRCTSKFLRDLKLRMEATRIRYPLTGWFLDSWQELLNEHRLAFGELYMEKLSYRTSIVDSIWTRVNYSLDSLDMIRPNSPDIRCHYKAEKKTDFFGMVIGVLNFLSFCKSSIVWTISRGSCGLGGPYRPLLTGFWANDISWSNEIGEPIEHPDV